MIIRKPINENELKYCVDIYANMNDYSFLEVDKEYCYLNIIQHWKMCEYIKIIEDKNNIVGFLFASQHNGTKHSRKKFLLQEYYCSNLIGFKSARAVILSHRDLIEEGKKQKVNYIISTGSHLDPEHIFTRILEKDGWVRRGHIAKYDLR